MLTKTETGLKNYKKGMRVRGRSSDTCQLPLFFSYIFSFLDHENPLL